MLPAKPIESATDKIKTMPTQQNNFYYMFVALIVFLVVLPLMEELDAMPTAMAQPLSISCLLLIGIWSLRETVSAFRVGIGLAVLSVLVSVFGFRQQSDAAYLLALGPFAGFLALAIWSALRQIVYTAYMSANKLIGAVCVYLMLGILWASFYAMVYKLNPMAFEGLPAEEKGNLGIGWVYYSFVTLTTLGKDKSGRKTVVQDMVEQGADC